MPPRPRRADALRNRERVLGAAWQLLAGDPASRPSVPEVAERAEVAVATVYRSFPTRALLYAAAFAHHLCDQVTPVVESLADDDPVEGLRRLSRAQVDVAAPWVELLATLPGWVEAVIDESNARFEEPVLAALVRAQEAGGLRDDLDREDIGGVTGLFLGGLSRTSQPLERAHRYIDIWFDAVTAPRP